MCINAILRCFELSSGLKVNFHKSKIGAIGVDRNEVKLYSEILHCSLMDIPFTYLGVTIGGNPSRCSFWKPVLSKIRKKLSVWKGRNLSFAGRVCLIKSVINAIPLFFLSFFKAPVGVCKEITKLQRKFLWGWGAEGSKIAWFSWENVCKAKKEGGLGIRRIDEFNKALLAKWLWRLESPETRLWKEVLDSKYVSRRLTNSSRWWNDITKVRTSDQGNNWFNANLVWKVGSGEKIKFWEDEWLDIGQLKERFESLYNNSELKDKTIDRCGRWSTEGWEWEFKWRREWFEWEKIMVEDFMTIISQVSLHQGTEDKRFWNDPPSYSFSVKSAYNKIANHTIGRGLEGFEHLWDLKVMPSALFYAWRAFSNRIATKQNLQRRGVAMEDTLCVLCGKEEETTSHILVLCEESIKVWNLCLSWLGISSVNHNDLICHFEQFSCLCLNQEGNRLWKSMWVSVVVYMEA